MPRIDVTAPSHRDQNVVKAPWLWGGGDMVRAKRGAGTSYPNPGLALMAENAPGCGRHSRLLGRPGQSLDQTVVLSTVAGKTKCVPEGLVAYCCDQLDYSGLQVECVGMLSHYSSSHQVQQFENYGLTSTCRCLGPGPVEYLEQCLEYESKPMCCCGIDMEKMPFPLCLGLKDEQ